VMMAVALATGDPLQGAALMFAFILGTSPVFFLVAYLTTQLGARLEKWFMRFVAAVALILGMVSINSGLNLAGFPLISLNHASASQNTLVTPSVSDLNDNTLILNAQNNGYSPSRIYAPADVDLTLNVLTKNTFSCSRAFLIPALNVEEILPETGVVPISIPAQPVGTVLRFTCSMGMYTGEIIFGD
jgi:uncharacterized protein